LFEVTPTAAKHIRRTATESDHDELALRIAASRESDGSISYKMGFDEIAEGDTLISTKGVDVLIRGADKELLQGTVLDFVELQPGENHFVFLNPNDPHYRPPTE
jgi:iron-sulfur cluster assembly protein